MMAGIFRCNSLNATPGKRVTLSPFCTSPGQLQDVTMDNSYSIGYRSPCLSLQHNGTTSPGQGRSVREFEEQMAALKKENFNLRLRIYFLEEKLSGYSQMTTPEGQESLMKQYIDNKVETEILLKDVEEKQKLLVEAAQAMTHMENIQKDTQKKNQEIIDELNQRIQMLEMENKELEKIDNDCEASKLIMDDFLGRSEVGVGGDITTLQRVRELEGNLRQFEDKNEELTIKIQELQEQINQKTDIVQETERRVKQLNFQIAELQEQLENKDKVIAAEEPASLREELHDYKVKLADKICIADDLEDKLKEKNMANEKAYQAIQKLMITIKEVQNENDRLRKNHPENLSQAKENTFGSNSTALCRSLSDSEGMSEVSILKMKLEKITKEKDTKIKNLELEIKKRTTNLQILVNKELAAKNREIERLTKFINKPNFNLLSTLSYSTTTDLQSKEELQQSSIDSSYTAVLEHNKYLQAKLDKLIQNLNTDDRNSNQLIQQLKLEVREARTDAERAHKWRKECSDGCAILTQRLEELAGFLDSLLKHKDILSGLASERRRAMRKAIDRSLDLSRSLNNMSLSISGLSLNDSSLIQLSNISGILGSSNIENKENKTFNSHDESVRTVGLTNSVAVATIALAETTQIEVLKAQVKALKKELERKKLIDPIKKDRKSLPMKLEIQSESEAWSEPDRNVSYARIGLEELNIVPKIKKIKDEEGGNTSTESETESNHRSKSKTQEKITQLEQVISQKDNKILEIQCELVDADNRLKKESLKIMDINRELHEYRNVNEMLEIEIATFKNQGINLDSFKLTEESLRREISEKSKLIEKVQEDRDKLAVESRVSAIQIENLKTEITELKQQHHKNIQLLKGEEEVKFNKLHNDLQANLEQKLKEQESKHQDALKNDWISRAMYDACHKDLELAHKKLSETHNTIDYLNENEAELKSHLIENEKSMRALKKSLDESTLCASKAVLERTKATNEKLKLENQVQELTKEFELAEIEKKLLKEKISQLENTNNNLNKKLLKINSNKTEKSSANGSDGQSGYTSEEMPITIGQNKSVHEQRLENSSPDLGIESDPGRTCNVEIERKSQNATMKSNENRSQTNEEEDNFNGNTETNHKNSQQSNEILTDDHECAKVYQENCDLRQKLKRTRRQLEDTLKQLRTANQKKEQVERDIRQQIVKTHVVLKNVRTNMETELLQHKKD